MGSTTDIKRDVFMRFNGAICIITDFQHVNPGKGSAFVRTKIKNVQTGKSLEHTFKVGESVDVVDLDRSTKQYLYKEADKPKFL